MKLQLQQSHWSVFFRNNIAIILAASLAFYLSWFVTVSYSLKGGLASWYFPAGMIIVALLHLHFRYWLALFIGARIGHYLYLGMPELMTVQEALWELIVAVANQLVPILGIVFIKLKKVPIRLDLVNSAIAILAAALFYRTVRFIQYYLMDANSLYGGVAEAQLFELFAIHIVTGFVAIFICLILAFTIRDVPRYWTSFTLHDKYLLTAQLLGLFVAIVLLYKYQANTLYLLNMLLFIPLAWITYRFGWAAAMLFVSGLIIMSLILLFRSADELLMVAYQPYIISYSLVAILLGAIINENNRIKERLMLQNSELEAKNAALKISNTKIKTIAQRVTQISEYERKVFSQALHDEFGQSLTAMKLGIYILEQKSHYLDSDSFAIVKKSAKEMYKNVYDLLHWLRPKIMDEIGLHQTITGNYFREKMASHNVRYHSAVCGDVESLSDSQKIGIFRIIQEATTNILKHAHAKNCYVSLTLNNKNIILSIEDDGQGMQALGTTSDGEYGLLGMEDKAMSLGGHVEFHCDDKFKIIITLPLSDES